MSKTESKETSKFTLAMIGIILGLGLYPFVFLLAIEMFNSLNNTLIPILYPSKFYAHAEIAGTYKEMPRLIEEEKQRQDFLNQIIIYKANCDGTEFIAEKFEGIKIEYENEIVVINLLNETIEYPLTRCIVYKKPFRDHFGEN